MNDTNNSKLLSVVMPVYNVRDYLKATLDCVLEQTYINWELFLVDDGSTDGSQEIEKEYAQNDSRITFIQRETLPKGAPACRIIGMKHIKGEYLIHLDSDDLIAPYCFQQRIDYMEQHPECDFVVAPLLGFYRKFFDANGMVFCYKQDNDAIFSLLARTLPFVVASNIYRTKPFLSGKVVWDTNLNIFLDSDYNLQTLHAGMKYEISDLLPDYFYRLSAQNSVCKKITSASRCESQIRYMEKQTAIFGQNKHYRKGLLICAAQIFQNLIRAKDNSQTVKHFAALDIFRGNPLLRWNLQFIAKIVTSGTNDSFVQALQLFLTPVFFLRFKFVLRKWEKERVIAYQEQSLRFKNEVDPNIQKTLEARV